CRGEGAYLSEQPFAEREQRRMLDRALRIDEIMTVTRRHAALGEQHETAVLEKRLGEQQTAERDAQAVDRGLVHELRIGVAEIRRVAARRRAAVMREPAAPARVVVVVFAEQRPASELGELRLAEPRDELRARDGRDEFLEQVLGREPGPLPGAEAQRRIDGFALEIHELDGRLQIDREARM